MEMQTFASINSNAAPEFLKVIVVMPAYNAESTLEKTFRDIPKGSVNEVILTDVVFALFRISRDSFYSFGDF